MKLALHRHGGCDHAKVRSPMKRGNARNAANSQPHHRLQYQVRKQKRIAEVQTHTDLIQKMRMSP